MSVCIWIGLIPLQQQALLLQKAEEGDLALGLTEGNAIDMAEHYV